MLRTSLVWLSLVIAVNGEELRLSVFKVDATPPIGSALCNGGREPVKAITTPLTAKGVVLLGAEQPIVLCSLDWVGIANESYDKYREAMAQAAGTTPDRVALHTVHQHDAPGSDFATERLLESHGLGGLYSDPEFNRDVMERLAAAVKASLAEAQPISRIGLGKAEVEKVASNRRILGPDGMVAIRRMSKSRDPEAKAAPEGTIDPHVRLVSFWNGEKPVAVLTYYATHPQSYYGKGLVNWDFVGMAREMRNEAMPGVEHIHFNGAGGNVAAGKYNDGSPEMRPILAERLAAGMAKAWDAQEKMPITAADVGWAVEPVALPLRDTLEEEALLAKLQDKKLFSPTDRIRAGRDLIFAQRINQGHLIDLSCLKLGEARILHMPGELFVEYQIAAQQMQPDNFVAMAAYGDSGPGYIGTEIAYSQGGYETGIVSRVGPEVEGVLKAAFDKLLRDSIPQE